MFFGKKTPVRSLIEEGTTLQGSIRFRHGLEFRGSLQGDICAQEPDSLLIIGRKADIKGKIEADNLVIDGRIEGPAIGAKSILIRKHGKIIGDVHYGRLQIESGGFVQGRLIPLEEETPTPTLETPTRN